MLKNKQNYETIKPHNIKMLFHNIFIYYPFIFAKYWVCTKNDLDS